MNQHNHNKGFSLIELLIVISLFFMVITLTIPKQEFMESAILTHEIEKLFMIFSFLQQKALASNSNLELTFSVTNNSYTYQLKNKSIKNHLTKQIQFGYLPLSKGPPSSPIHNITDAITFGHNQKKYVTFLANGSITPGTLYLINKKKKEMKALTCPISQVSYIRKYSYNAHQWISN